MTTKITKRNFEMCLQKGKGPQKENFLNKVTFLVLVELIASTLRAVMELRNYKYPITVKEQLVVLYGSNGIDEAIVEDLEQLAGMSYKTSSLIRN
jgi:hypothetical protein